MKRLYYSGRYLILLVSSLAVLQVTSCKKELRPATADDTNIAVMGKPSGSVTVTRNLLKIPAVVTAPSNYDLTAAVGTTSLTTGGPSVQVWQYNNGFPGPTLVATKGDNVSINLKNNLPEPTIIHWHGMLVDHDNDGQPMQAVPTGGTYNYSYEIKNRAALNWYHPHPHFLTGKQVYNGLAGAFIIRDAEEASKGLPSGKYEVPLILRDISLDKNNKPIYSPTGGGFFGKTPLVNGTKDPYLDVDKTVYRFRIVVGSTSRLFKLALSDNSPFILIGNDGGLLASSSNISLVEVSPGERLDLLVDFRGKTAGTKIMLKELNSGWDLLEFRVNSTAVAYTGSILPTSAITALSAPVTTRFFSFDGMGKINGNIYDMNKIEFDVPFNTVEKWIFKTNGNGPHPVHIHGASFQVLNRTGGRGQLFPWEAGWKDVVLVNDFETVEVLIKFEAYKGVYLIHCHKLEHEDNGMMMNFEVK